MFTNNYRDAVTFVAPLFGKYKNGDDDLMLATRYCHWVRCVLAGATKPKFFPHWTILVRYHFMWELFLLQARLRPEAQDVGPRQGRASDRRRLFPDVRQPGLHRDRFLCRHLQRASQGIRNSPHEPLEGADGLSFFLFSPPHCLSIR